MARPNIINLNNARVESASYFVDANVWLYSLQAFASLPSWQQKYFDFFWEIIGSTLTPRPKILLTPLLISEIVNIYLKQVALPEYLAMNPGLTFGPSDYKRIYRPTNHYKDSYEKIMDDLAGISGSVKFIDDAGIIHNPGVVLNRDIGIFDYNDYIYYALCQQLATSENVIILTNDSDFQVTDLKVITLNRTLLTF